MNNFEVNFNITLEDSEVILLKQILGVNDTDSLDDVLSDYAQASLEEYISMFMGQKVFTRGSDFKEYRLFLIIKKALEERIPNEETVSSLFQLTATESRSLIRSVMSKYQYDLNSAIDNSIKETLKSVNRQDDPYSFTSTKNIVSHLNRILSSMDGGILEPVKQKSNTTAIYEIKPSAYNRLIEKFEITIEQEA